MEDLYLAFWKQTLTKIRNEFQAGKNPVQFTIPEIASVGDRSSYNGSVLFRFGEAVTNTDSAPFRDLVKAIKTTPAIKPYLSGELSIRISGEFQLTAAFKKGGIADLIAAYKKLVENGNRDLYKWKLLGKPHFDLDATDFAGMTKGIDFRNLIFHNARGVLNELSSNYPEEVRDAFINLFSEDKDLRQRIEEFRGVMEVMYRRTQPVLATHQDERSIATYLTYHKPEKYSLYKESFYSKYCRYLDVKPAEVNEKYIHYLQLVSELIEKYIRTDKELKQLEKDFTPEDGFADPNFTLLAQDILYQTLEMGKEENADIEEEDDNKIRYYLGGAAWNDGDHTKEFIDGGYWENGYSEDYIEIVKQISVGSLIAIKSSFAKGRDSILRIKCIGEVTENAGDGLTVYVKWQKPFESFDLVGLGSYRTTVQQVTDADDITTIFYHDKKTPDINKPQTNAMLNTILYGPPGTGKTYHTIAKAIAIAEPSFETNRTRTEIKEAFERLVKDGRIVFVTFHQSMSYEDFIEGIKPTIAEGELTYEIQDGIFKLLCNKARFIDGNLENVIEKFKLDISEQEGKTPLTITAKGTEFKIVYRGSSVFYVQPKNTTKDNPWYPVNIDHIRKVFETDSFDNVYNHTYIREVIAYLKKNYNLSKHHQPEREKENYVLIIDEINRGNVSQIFGELITLIETDKREGNAEQLSTQLPYSKLPFSVPNNLFIIGTMNTADRSVEALDTALRRRFAFEEMMPEPELLSPHHILKQLWAQYWKMSTEEFEKKQLVPFEREWNITIDLLKHRSLEKESEHLSLDEWKEINPELFFKDVFKERDNYINLYKLLTTINKRLEILLSKDHTIGHAWLMGATTLPLLQHVFKNKILPLLQEYFYNTYAKIGLVLGDAFIKQTPVNKDSFAKLKKGDDLLNDYDEKIIYTLADPNKLEATDFLSIYQ